MQCERCGEDAVKRVVAVLVKRGHCRVFYSEEHTIKDKSIELCKKCATAIENAVEKFWSG